MRRIRSGRARGSAALELVLLTPLVLVMIELVVAGGRVTQAQSIVDEAAHSGARAASRAPTAAAARASAAQVVEQTLVSTHSACGNPEVSVDASAFHPGGSVAVDVTCHASLRDLTLLPLPGTHAQHSRATSPIDVYAVAGP